MSIPTETDAYKLPALLNALRLPSFKKHWQDVTARADREGWSTAQALALLAEHELAGPEGAGGTVAAPGGDAAGEPGGPRGRSARTARETGRIGNRFRVDFAALSGQ